MSAHNVFRNASFAVADHFFLYVEGLKRFFCPALQEKQPDQLQYRKRNHILMLHDHASHIKRIICLVSVPRSGSITGLFAAFPGSEKYYNVSILCT